jgi:hypothetical protein
MTSSSTQRCVVDHDEELGAGGPDRRHESINGLGDR